MEKSVLKLRHLFLMLFCVLWICPLYAQKIKTKRENGVTVVYNPKHPKSQPGMPKRLALIEDLCIGDETEDENYMFSVIRSVQVDDDEDIFVLNWKPKCIKVFDREGRHIRTFGKVGQGPGEIQDPLRMYLAGGNDITILDWANHRFSYYSKAGKCLKEIDTGKYAFMGRAMADSQGYIYGDYVSFSEETELELIKFDSSFKPIKTIATIERTTNPRELNLLSDGFSFQVSRNDELIYGKRSKYKFYILNQDGELTRQIIKDYDKIKISDKDKKAMIKEEFGEQGIPAAYTITFPRHYPPFQNFICDDKGRLFVRTYVHDDRSQVYYDVFDAQGRYITKFSHPIGELIFFGKKNKLYCIVAENEEGIPVIKRYRLEWN